MLDQLDQRVRRLARDYLTKPVVPLVAELAALRNRLFGLLGERQALSHARGLYVLACRVCGLLACASSDRFGAYRAAAQQAETAWLCAKEAGYGELKAWVRSIQSTIDFWRGRYQEAAERARAGQAYAREGLELVRLASLEARACGRLGDARGVQGAVALATAARDGASGQDEGRHAGAFGFSVANQVRCAGSARLWLGDPRAVAQAREELDQALRLFDADPEGRSYAHQELQGLRRVRAIPSAMPKRSPARTA